MDLYVKYYPYSHANLCLEIILYEIFAFGGGGVREVCLNTEKIATIT